MGDQSSVDQLMARLDCHFNWPLKKNSDFDGRKLNAEKLETKILADIKNNPPIAFNAYSLLAYSFSSGDRDNIDFAKSLEYIEKANVKVKTSADEYLVRANRFCIMKIKGSPVANLESLKEIKESVSYLSKEDIAHIRVSQGYSLSNFTIPPYKEALERYREAAKNDPKNSEAHYGIGKMLGRLRRSVNGPFCKATAEELESFERAIELWPSNPFYIVFNALALSYELVKDDVIDLAMVNSMEKLLKRALKEVETNEMFQQSASVYKWCGKGYKQMCMARSKSASRLTKKQYGDFVNMQKKCIDKAAELSPNNSSILNEAGLFYWKIRFYRDDEKAEAFLRKAVVAHVYKCNFWADINLIQFCKETKQEYNPIEEYCTLKVKYQDTPDYQGFIHERIGMEYEEQEEYEKARHEYYTAMTCSEDNTHIQKAPKRQLSLLEQFVSESTEKFNNDPKYFSQHIQDLFEAAEMYLAFSPKHLGPRKKPLIEAQELYETIQNIDSERDNEARSGLCTILLERELYDQCIQKCQEIQTEDTFKANILGEAYFQKANGAPEYSDPCKFNQDPLSFNRNVRFDPLKPNQCKVNLPENMNISLYFLSALCGKLESASLFTEQVTSKILAEHQHYKANTEIYEKFALIQNIFKDERTIASQIEAALELKGNSPFCPVRQARYRMSRSWSRHLPNTAASACSTLQECRSILDRTVLQFWMKNYFGINIPKPKCYFPYYYPKNTGTVQGSKQKQDKNKSKDRVDRYMSKSLDIPSFKANHPELCTFLAYRTPIYDKFYDFVPIFCTLVNIHKHEADITSQKDTQKLAELYELAHKAAEFTEDVVSKFYEYI